MVAKIQSFDDLDFFDLEHIETVQGSNHAKDIFIFAISTCQWCKKCKRWLKGRDYRYRYVDVDKIPIDEKRKIKDHLKKIFDVKRVSFPFVVVDSVHYVSGYDPDKLEELVTS